MRLTPQDEEIIETIKFDQHVSIQAAAYAVYVGLTPNNKKPISQREFHQIFKDNWQAFCSLEIENSEQDD
ncbi:hypothetical protein ACIZ62_16415 [Acetobacterium carbinolicum]|uniref:hypothetical protein n=1 Tax=Acetobacterium carbinolicum TaxID=52690 RepID=UPI0039BED80C